MFLFGSWTAGCQSSPSRKKKESKKELSNHRSEKKPKDQTPEWMIAAPGGSSHTRTASLDLKNLPHLQVMNESLDNVQKRYVDPERIRTDKMLMEGLREVQEEVAALRIRLLPVSVEDQVKAGPADRIIEVRVGQRVHLLPFKKPATVDELYAYFRVILGLVRKELASTGGLTKEEQDNMEYAAINGFLGTLDPYSVLLPPTAYSEVRIRTHGSFGGVGIVISIRNGALTVISPIDGTPAAKAGVMAMDRIIRIGEESTINMPLHEAVNRLRGKVGSKVTFWVERDSLPEPKKITLTRGNIEIHSVSSRMLPGRIGYVRVNRFSDNTYQTLKQHIGKLKKGGVQSIILDLTNNPGGLLKQAVAVADAFLDRGTIVVTEGAGRMRLDADEATPSQTVWSGPLVVLVNRGSASASEIVAGALKYHNRAVVLGERTFGKGSVQVLLTYDEGAALKLTVARYMVRGDVPIQTVGIMPDILTVPVTIRKDWIRFTDRTERSGEQQLEDHLSPGRPVKVPKPFFTLRYIQADLSKKKLSDIVESGADPTLLELARDLLVRYQSGRSQVLAESVGFLKRERARQERRIIMELKQLGVDFRPGPKDTGQEGPFKVRLFTDKSKDTINAGDTAMLTLSVRNKGRKPAYRIRGVLDAPGYYLDGREFMLGRIAPNQMRSWSVKLKIPSFASSQLHPVKVKLFADKKEIKNVESAGVTPSSTFKIKIVEKPRPSLSLLYSLHELEGNGDGLLSPGETAEMRCRLKNNGPEIGKEMVVSLRNQSGKWLFIKKGRVLVKELAPGAEQEVRLTFKLLDRYKDKSIKLELGVYASPVRLGFENRLELKLSDPARSLSGRMEPPDIRIQPLPLVTRQITVLVKGVTRHFQALRDLYVVEANTQAKKPREKIYYKPASPAETRLMHFQTTANLMPGLNTILVVARVNKHLMGYRLMSVLREAPPPDGDTAHARAR